LYALAMSTAEKCANGWIASVWGRSFGSTEWSGFILNCDMKEDLSMIFCGEHTSWAWTACVHLQCFSRPLNAHLFSFAPMGPSSRTMVWTSDNQAREELGRGFQYGSMPKIWPIWPRTIRKHGRTRVHFGCCSRSPKAHHSLPTGDLQGGLLYSFRECIVCCSVSGRNCVLGPFGRFSMFWNNDILLPTCVPLDWKTRFQ